MLTLETIKLVSLLQSFDKHTGHYARVTYRSEPKMRVGRKPYRNPYLGRVHKVSEIEIRSQAYVPQSEVDEEIAKRVRENMERISTHLVRYISTGTICMQCKPTDVIKTTWFVDNREATPAEREELQAWLPKPKGPSEVISLNVEKIQALKMEKQSWYRGE